MITRRSPRHTSARQFSFLNFLRRGREKRLRRRQYDMAFAPAAEMLEDRTLLSAITWTNRGLTNDRFDDVFDAGAEAAREVVDAVLESWQRVINDFNQPSGGNNLDVTIKMAASGERHGAEASGLLFDSGYPTAGTITLQRGDDTNGDGDGDGAGYFIDPTPLDNSEFTGTIQNAFTGNASDPDAMGNFDFFSLVNAELTHVVGLFFDPALINAGPLNGMITDTTVADDSEGGGTGTYFVFDGPSVTHLMTSFDSGGGDTMALIHSAGPPNGPNQPLTFNSSFRGTRDLVGTNDPGNASYAQGARILVNDVTALIFADAYEYDINLPQTFGTMYSILDDMTGDLLLRGGSGVSDDTFSIEVVGGNLQVTTDIGNDAAGSGPNGDDSDIAPFVSRFALADVTSITVEGLGGNDTLTVDFGNGSPIPAGGIEFNGGAGFDDLVLKNGPGINTGPAINTVSHRFDSPSAGGILVDGGSIEYTGLSPILDNLNAANRVFTFTSPIADGTLTRSPGLLGVAHTRIDSALSEMVDFLTPTATLDIILSSAGANTFSVNSLADFYDTPDNDISGGTAGNTINFEVTDGAAISGITNGGFETGSFTAWSTTGTTSIETAAFGTGPTGGTFQALMTTGGAAVSDTAIEALLGLTPGALDGLSTGDATEGAAIVQTIQGDAGQTISFDWNMLTNELTPEIFGFNDFAFWSLVNINNGAVLADTFDPNFAASGTSFNEETGFFNFSMVLPTSGTFMLGFGVMDVNDFIVDSGLLIDNVSVPTIIATANTWDVFGSSGTDTVNISPIGMFLDNLDDNIEFFGGGGSSDTLNIRDDNSLFGDTFTVTNTTVDRPFWGEDINPGATYDVDVEFVNLVTTGSGNNTVNVLSTSANALTTINTDSGTDTINITPFLQDMDTILGPVIVNGGSGFDTLNLDDRQHAAGETYDITSTTVNRTGLFAGLTHSNINELSLNAGSGNDAITVAAGTYGFSVIVDGGLGTDSLAADSVDISGTNADGLAVSHVETVNISNSTFDNNAGDGIQLTSVGAVTTTNVTATGNDPGIFISGAVSYTDIDGNFSGNDDHGIHLIDIAGTVALVRTTLENNDADNNGIGDGLFAEDGPDGDSVAIGNALGVFGATIRDTDGAGGAFHQEIGVNIPDGVGDDVFFVNSGGIEVTVTGNDDDGVFIDGMDEATFINGTYSNNAATGINLENVNVLTIDGTTLANDNGDDGVAVDDFETANVDSLTTNNNAASGAEFENGGTLNITNVTANNNDENGFVGESISGTTTITGGTFNNNDDDNAGGGDGISLSRVGNVFTTGGVTATGNDPGIFIDRAGSYTDTDGNFSGNNDHGIHLIDIAGNVILTRTTANNNDADNDNVGDGVRAEDGADGNAYAIGGQLIVRGGQYLDTNSTAFGLWQENGIWVVDGVNGNVTLENEAGGGQITMQGNDQPGFNLDGANNANVTITNGRYRLNLDGIQIDNADAVLLLNVDADSNRQDGLDVDPTTSLTVVNGTYSGNFADGMKLDDVTTVTITGANISNNQSDGIDLDNSTNVTLTNVTANANRVHGFNGFDISSVTDIVGGMYNDNDADNNGSGDGIHIVTANLVLTRSGVTATGNDPGIFIDGASSYTDTDGNFSNNDNHGIQLIDIAGDVSLTRTTANDNDADNDDIGSGLRAEDGGDRDLFAIGGTLTILGSTFNDTNGAGGGVWQERGVFISGGVQGDVLLEDEAGGGSNTITGNDNDGFDLNGANNANVTITNGTFSNNGTAVAGTGIEIDNADTVTITNVTADGNSGNGLDVDPTLQVLVDGGTFNNNLGDGIDLDDVTFVNIIGFAVANNNGDDGLDLVNFSAAGISTFTTNANGGNGMEISNGTVLTINDWVTIGNNSNIRPGNQFQNIETVNFTTTTVPDDTVDKVDIYETDFQHTRAMVMQDFVEYIGIGTMNFDARGGMDVYVIQTNVSNPANAVDINLDGGTPSAGPNARPGDKLVMAGFNTNAFFTDPSTGTGIATNFVGNPIDFTDIENIVVADEHEFNGTLITATVLGSDMAILTGGSIHNVFDEDYYKVTAKITGVLQVNLYTMFGPHMDLDMQILDADGDMIATLDSATDNEFVAIPVVAQKMYHVRVYGKNNDNGGMNFGNYDLEIENTPLAITPQAVHMDPADDTGMMNDDSYTADTMPRFIIQADLAEIVDPNNDGVNDIAILTPMQADADMPGVAVWVSITDSFGTVVETGFAQQLGGSSLFAFTPAGLGDGVYFITSAVWIIDSSSPAMEDRGPLSVPLWFTIDTRAPDSATKDMLASSDSFHAPIGTNFDNLTNKMSPAFDGLAEANAKIRLYANNLLVGSGVVNTENSDANDDNGLGTWEITSEPLADGTYNISVEVEDLAGNISERVNGLEIVIDTRPPQRPTIDLLDVDDSGMMNMDNVTNVFPNQRFRVTAEPGSWVVVKDGLRAIETFVMPAVGFIPISLNLAEGPHPLSVEAFDAADNRSDQSHELLVTIDTIAPNPDDVTKDLIDSSDSFHPMIGTNTDNLTNIDAPAFAGLAEANAKIRLYANGLLVGSGVVNTENSDDNDDNGLGTWEITSEPLADGTYNISVEVEDLAGNISERVNGLEIVIDTLPPQRPTIDLLDEDDSGMMDMDNVTNVTPLTFRISAEPGSWVVVKNGETVHFQFTMPNDSFVTLLTGLTEGPHPLSVEAFDAADNRSNQSHELLVTIDTISPNPDVAPDLLASSDTGMSNADNVTNKMRPAFSGTQVEPNVKVRVYANNVLVGQGVTTTFGSWEVTVEPLADGVYSITTELEDLAGNISARSEALTIEIDTLAPNLPFLDLLETDDFGHDPDDNITNQNQVLLSVTTHDPNAAIHLFEDNLKYRIYDRLEESPEILLYDSFIVSRDFTSLTQIFTTADLLRGDTILGPLADGNHNLKLEVEDRAGNISPDFLLDLAIDTLAPQADVPDLLESSDSGMTNNDNVTNKMQPAFTGVSEVNAIVRVFATDVNTGTTQLVGLGVVGSDLSDGVLGNRQGRYEVTVEPLDDAVYDIFVEIEDWAGNQNTSDSLRIVIDTVAPNTPYLDLLDDTGHSATDNITGDNTPEVSMTSEDPNIALALALFQDNLKFRIFDRYEGDAEFLLYDSIGDAAVFSTSDPADFFTELTLILETLPDQYTAFFGNNPPAIVAPGVLADGVHNLKLEVEDRAGNISHDFLLSIEIDTTTLLIVTPVLLESSDTGMLNDDMVINKMQPAFMGVAEANAIIRIYARDVDTGTVQFVGENIVGSDLSDVSIGGVAGLGGAPDDGYGLWEITVEPLDDGHYEIFVEVEDWAGNIVVSEPKEIWIDTVEPNTPFLDLITDSGRHDADNVTNVNRPTFDINVDDTPNGGLNPFPNDLKYRIYLRPGDASGEILIYDSYSDNGNNFVTGGSFTHTLTETLNDPLGLSFANGVYDLKLEVEDRAGNMSHDFLLGLTIDTIAPPKSFGDPFVANDGLHPDSDSGVDGYPNLTVDRITNDTTPTMFGRAEADSIVRLFVTDAGGAIVQIGQTVAIPLDGNLAFPDGEWSITSTFDMNDPSLGLGLDGLRTLSITAEDLAGNISEPMLLDIFIDTQGPRVFDPDGAGAQQAIQVITAGVPNATFDLFDIKPTTGPTPRTDGLLINISDLPDRIGVFLYDALQEGIPNHAENPGHYQLTGDTVGNVAISRIRIDPILIAGNPATATIQLDFFEPLQDDRYTLTLRDTLTDPAGNALDGESNANEPNDGPTFPSGDLTPGGDFVARFTIDSRAEIGTWGQAGIFIDANGNYLFDPPVAGGINHDVSRDLVFNIGIQTDNIFAGQFKPAGAAAVNGYDRIGAYGLIGGTYRFLLDFNDNGRIDAGETITSNVQVSAFPISGNFDGNAANGDEIGLFDGATWYFDTTGDNLLDTTIGGGLRGLPIVGDFDGDGLVDLGTHIASSNAFFFSLSSGGGSLAGGNSDTTDTFAFGFPGVLERPFAGGDFNLDGIDDFGLTTPSQDGTDGELEWYIIVSDRLPGFPGGGGGGLGGGIGGGIFDAFTPSPLGNDIFTLYNGIIAAPVVGNFDPPNSLTSTTEFEPLAGTTDTTPTLQWNDVGGASEYEVLLYNVDAGQQVAHAIVEDNSFTPTLEANINYQSFVRPVNNYDQAGSWSSPYYFSIDGVSAPQVTSPVGSTDDATPTIAWTTSDGATSYNLLVYSLSTGQETIHSFGQAATSYTPTAPLPGAGEYQVFVQASDANGTSNWSAAHVFELTAGVASLPGSPTVTAPTGTESDYTPTVVWTVGENADSYEMLVYNIGTGQEVANETGLAGTSFTFVTPLAVSGTHQIYLRAVNDLGNSGWNGPFLFELALDGNAAPSAPTLLSPSGSSDDFTATFDWTASDNADSYELLVYHIETGQQVFWQSNLGGTSYTPSSSLPGAGHYQVFLRATNAFGTSAWSAPTTFELVASLDDSELWPLETDEVEQQDLIDTADETVAEVSTNETTSAETANTSEEVSTENLDAVMAQWSNTDWWQEPTAVE